MFQGLIFPIFCILLLKDARHYYHSLCTIVLPLSFTLSCIKILRIPHLLFDCLAVLPIGLECDCRGRIPSTSEAGHFKVIVEAPNITDGVST